MRKAKINVSIIMDRDRHAELATLAKKRGMSLAAFMRDAAFKEVEAQRDREVAQ